MPKKKKTSIVATSAPESYVFLVCYLIGIIRMVFLQRTISFQGIAAYAYAFELYNILYLLAGGMLAKSSAKLIKNRSIKEQYKNRDQIFSYILIRSFIVAAVCTLIFLFFGQTIAAILGYKLSAFAIECFAFAFIPACLFVAFQQYLEGIGYHIPSVFARLLVDLSGLLATLIISNFFFAYGKKVGSLLLDSSRQYGFGAAAVAISDLIGLCVGLIFVLVLYLLMFRMLRKANANDDSRVIEKNKYVIRMTEMTAFKDGSILIAANLSTIVMQILYFKLARGKLMDKAAGYGAYYCIVQVFLVFAIYLITIYSEHLQKALRHYMKIDDIHRFRMRFQQSLKLLMIFFMPIVVFVVSFAEHILKLLYTGKSQNYLLLLQAGVVLLLLSVFRLVFETVIAVKGHKSQLYICLYGGLLTQVVIFAFVFANTKTAYNGIVYSGLIAGAVECVLAYILAGMNIRLKIDFKKTLIYPIVIGLLVMLLDVGFEVFLSDRLGSFATLLLGFIVTFAVYYAIIIKTGIVRARELMELPFGKQISVYASILGLRE